MTGTLVRLHTRGTSQVMHLQTLKAYPSAPTTSTTTPGSRSNAVLPMGDEAAAAQPKTNVLRRFSMAVDRGDAAACVCTAIAVFVSLHPVCNQYNRENRATRHTGFDIHRPLPLLSSSTENLVAMSDAHSLLEPPLLPQASRTLLTMPRRPHQLLPGRGQACRAAPLQGHLTVRAGHRRVHDRLCKVSDDGLGPRRACMGHAPGQQPTLRPL